MCSCDRPAHHGAGGWSCPPLSLDNRPDKPCYVYVWSGNVPNRLNTFIVHEVTAEESLWQATFKSSHYLQENMNDFQDAFRLHCVFHVGQATFDTEIHAFLLNIKAATQICELQIRTTFETLRVVFYVPLNQQNKWLMQKYWITFMFTWAGILLICQPLA